MQMGSTYPTPGGASPYLNVTAIELVTVPAGTFQAWRLEYSEFYSQYIYWFEQNTGILLRVEQYHCSAGCGAERSLTYEAELVGSSLFQ